jgi:Protein of unknown function (DUF3431)
VASRQIVIARYEEDVSWAAGLPAVVYNKGTAIDASIQQLPLPNVGREAHTYLSHILRAWDELADVTLFTQGNLDHLPSGIQLDDLLDSPNDVVVPRLVRCREWGPDGRIVHFGIWKEKLAHGRMRAGRLPFVDWFRRHLNVDPEGLGAVAYAPGAIFAVKRRCIHERPRTLYENLIETVSDHNDPEEAHYLERAWLYVFAASEVTVRYLSV